MAISNREPAIKKTLQWEGGYSNNPADPGGPTMYGITIADVKKYYKADATAADVKKLPLNAAVDIYRTKYWKTPYYDCDKLAPGVDLVVFDFGVNSGPSRAKSYLMKAVGGTDEETINKICDMRVAFLKGLNKPVFEAGWLRRVADIRKTALQMSKTPIISTSTAASGGAVIAGAAAYNYWPLPTWALIAGGIFTTILVGYGIYRLHQYNKAKNT